MKSHRLFQAPPHAVSFDRVAMFLGDGEADAGFGLWFLPVEDFEQEEAAPALFAIADSKKLRAAFQPPGSHFLLIGRQFARHLLSGNSALGRKTLAAACAASNDNLTAALGGHACTETVAALANKLGWLVGTLHLFKHRGVRPFLNLHIARSVVFRTGEANESLI
ncbi:hypothetical protein FHT76_003324 [Rhizobium sp. BK176]|nr:hypothetical protein [Rhizobium sp. BK181]MCS4091665.1 hypothetical protein [Rhizobium sp. BK176]